MGPGASDHDTEDDHLRNPTMPIYLMLSAQSHEYDNRWNKSPFKIEEPSIPESGNHPGNQGGYNYSDPRLHSVAVHGR